jgi:phage regulator Rha-like protein
MKIVTIENSEPVTTTLAIAEGANLAHASVIKLVRKYELDLRDFGLVGFEIQARLDGQHGGGEAEYAILNERQSTLLFTYMRNSPVVREFKKALVREFWRLAESQIAKHDRQASRLEAPEMTGAVQESRKLLGKETQVHHYSNEYNLINRLVLGQTSKQYISEHGLSPSTAIRDTMRPVEIQAIAALQRANTSFIDAGVEYSERKVLLTTLHNRKFKQRLIDEVFKIES